MHGKASNLKEQSATARPSNRLFRAGDLNKCHFSVLSQLLVIATPGGRVLQSHGVEVSCKIRKISTRSEFQNDSYTVSY